VGWAGVKREGGLGRGKGAEERIGGLRDEKGRRGQERREQSDRGDGMRDCEGRGRD